MSEDRMVCETDLSDLLELAVMATPIVGDVLLWGKYQSMQESPYKGRGEPRPFYQILGAKYLALTTGLVVLEATTGAVSSGYKMLENMF